MTIGTSNVILVAVALVATAVVAQAVDSCYRASSYMCSTLWADAGRVCVRGSVKVKCPDFVMYDESVADVVTGLDTRGPLAANTNVNKTKIEFWKCNGLDGNQTCDIVGLQEKQCWGRSATGSACH